mgnify:FL=1
MTSKLKSPKNVDLSQNSGRKNLLKQRLVGNDVGSDSNSLSQARDPSSSIGLVENMNGEMVVIPSRSNSVTIHTDNSRKMVDEVQYKEELRRHLREEKEKSG